MRFRTLTRSEAIALARQKGGALGGVAFLGLALAYWKLTGTVTSWPLYAFGVTGAVVGGFVGGRWAAIRYDETQRASDHFCTKCGYNLTGNASGVCPECGTTIPRGPQPDMTPRIRVYDDEFDLKATIIFASLAVVGVVLMIGSPGTFGLGLLMTVFFGLGALVGGLSQFTRRRPR